MAVKLPDVASSLPIPRGSGIVVRQPVDPTGQAMAQLGRDIQGAGNELYQAFESERQRINKVRVEDSFTELRNSQIDLTIGQENGFQNLKSGDAVKRPILKEWSDRFDSSVTSIAARLENNEQREAFKRRADVAKTQFTQDILQHLNRENSVYNAQVLESTVATETNAALVHWNNPGDAMASVARVKAAFNSYAETSGLAADETVKNSELLKRTSIIHGSIISKAVDEGNPQYAELWFKTHRSEIDAKTAERLGEMMKTGAVRVKAQQATDKIMGMNLSETEAKKYAREKYTGVERDEVINRINSRYTELSQEQSASFKAAEDEAWNIVVNPASSIDSIPPSLWTRMSGESKKQVASYIDARNKKEKKEDDWNVLDTVESAISTGDITEPSQLIRYEPFLRDSTIRTLRKKVEKRGEISATLVQRSFEDRIGKTRAKWNKAEQKQWIAYQGYVLDNVRETKRPEDINVWADKWFMEGYGSKDSMFVNDPNTYGEAYTAGRDDFMATTPDEYKTEIGTTLEYLRKANINVPATDAATDEFYTTHYIEGSRWFNARDLSITPQKMAAFAILRSKNQPVTEANINFVAEQLR